MRNIEIVVQETRNTPLHRVAALDEAYGGEVYVKDESVQPTGTFKDRRTAEMAACTGLLTDRGHVILATITSGNSGASVEYWVQRINELTGKGTLVSLSFVEQSVETKLGNRPGCHVVPTPLKDRFLTEEDFVNAACNCAGQIGISDLQGLLFLEWRTAFVSDYDRQRHLEVGPHSVAFGRIVDEVIQDVGNEVTIACPVGNGELYLALVCAAAWQNQKGANVSVIGGTVDGNPFARQILAGYAGNPQILRDTMARGATPIDTLKTASYLRTARHVDIEPDLNHPRSIADKLTCPDSRYRKLLEQRELRPQIAIADEHDVVYEHELWQRLGITSEPSACVGGIAARLTNRLYETLDQRHAERYVENPLKPKIVIVNTGRGKL